MTAWNSPGHTPTMRLVLLSLTVFAALSLAKRDLEDIAGDLQRQLDQLDNLYDSMNIGADKTEELSEEHFTIISEGSVDMQDEALVDELVSEVFETSSDVESVADKTVPVEESKSVSQKFWGFFGY